MKEPFMIFVYVYLIVATTWIYLLLAGQADNFISGILNIIK